jgi:hypothetical protein
MSAFSLGIRTHRSICNLFQVMDITLTPLSDGGGENE